MAIATNKALIGKSIVLLDGTKTKITAAVATGYKVADRSVRVNSKQVAKKGAMFYEIPNVSLRELNDTGNGYVEFSDKAMQKKVGTDAFLEKPAKATGKKTSGRKPAEDKPAKTTGRKTSGRKPAEDVEDVEEKPSKVRRKAADVDVEETTGRTVKRRGAKNAGVEMSDFGIKPKGTVSLSEVGEPLAKVITERLMAVAKDSSLAKFDENNAAIQNAFEVGYSTEFDRTGGDIRVTMNFKYALAQPEPEEINGGYEISPELAKKIKSRVGKTVGKKLAAAISEHLGVDASDMTAGTLLVREGEDGQFVFCGASVDDNNKAVLFNTETEKFRTISTGSLSHYELVAEDEDEDEDEEEEEEEEEESEEDEEDEDDSEDGEDSDDDSEDGEDEDGEEYEYVSLTKKQLAGRDSEVTEENLSMLSELWGVPESALVAGLKLTDGEDTLIYVGMDEDADLLVIEEGGKEVVAFSNEDISGLSEYSPVVSDEDGEDSNEEDEDFEEGEDDDYEDLDEDELRDIVVQKGLAKVRAAENMSEKKLRALLAKG